MLTEQSTGWFTTLQPTVGLYTVAQQFTKKGESFQAALSTNNSLAATSSVCSLTDGITQ